MLVTLAKNEYIHASFAKARSTKVLYIVYRPFSLSIRTPSLVPHQSNADNARISSPFSLAFVTLPCEF